MFKRLFNKVDQLFRNFVGDDEPYERCFVLGGWTIVVSRSLFGFADIRKCALYMYKRLRMVEDPNGYYEPMPMFDKQVKLFHLYTGADVWLDWEIHLPIIGFNSTNFRPFAKKGSQKCSR